MPVMIHPTAIVHETAQIGQRTKIWHFSVIHEGAEIGRECTIGQNVYIGPGVVIGNRVRIQNNVSVYAGVAIESDAFIGPSVVFTNCHLPVAGKRQPPAKTVVGKRAMLGANCTIVAPCKIGEDVIVGAGCVVTSNLPDGIMVIGNPARRIR